MQIISFLIIILWITLLIYWMVSAVKSKRNFRNYNWRFEILLRLIIIVIIILFFHVPILRQFADNLQSQPFYSNPIVIALGFVIFLLGYALTLWARVSLGKNWGMPMTIKEKPELVISGPYAYIRHPIYSGMILAMLGTSLAVNGYLIIPLIIVSFYFIFSSRIEERNMLQLFPKDYEKYRKKTNALIPFIY